jgi:hypothetical protein
VLFSDLFKLFLESKKEFSSCSLDEMCKFLIDEDKANAHAGMPFCGISRFVVPIFLLALATALLGRGSFAFIVYRHAQPHLGKCNDSRPFFIHTKLGEDLCGTGQIP